MSKNQLTVTLATAEDRDEFIPPDEQLRPKPSRDRNEEGWNQTRSHLAKFLTP